MCVCIYRVRFKWKLKSDCEREDRRDHATCPIRLIFSLNNLVLFRLNMSRIRHVAPSRRSSRSQSDLSFHLNLILYIYIYIYIYIYVGSQNIYFSHLDLPLVYYQKRTKSLIVNCTLPVSTASASLDFQCFAIFSERGSSGFGALRRAWMLIDTIEQCKCQPSILIADESNK